MNTQELERQLSQLSWKFRGDLNDAVELFIPLPGERTQQVSLWREGSWIRLESRAFHIHALDPTPTLSEQVDTIMRLNRKLELIVVGIDEEGWIVGTADVPAEAAVDQVITIAERLAKLCDWWEAVFAGTDELHETTSS